MPGVSVIIPCFNLGEFLYEAVDSVLAQTFDDFEIIIVDDGSDDPLTVDVLKRYDHPRVRVIHTVNCGVAAARNRGIEEGSGTYILPLDADDRIAPNYLEQAVAALEADSDVGIVYCRAELFGEKRGEWNLPAYSLPHLLLDNQIFSAALFRREDWVRTEGYDQAMAQGWEDWDFWLRLIAVRKKVVQLPEILFSYRIRRGSRDRSLGLLAKSRLMMQLVLNNRRMYQSHALEILQILISGKRRRQAARG